MSQPDYLDETHQRIAEFAEEFLEDEERDEFIDGLLERRGYQRATRWLPPEPSTGPGGKKPLIRPGGKPAGKGGSGGGRGSYFGGGR